MKTAPPRGLGRDTLVLAAGLGAAQALTLAVMPLWSRLYSPAEFAAWGLWLSVVGVVSTLLLLRYDTCIVIARSDAEARALLRLCLRLSLGGGGLLALVVWMLPGRVQAALGLQALGTWLPLAVVGGALAAAFAALLAWANRQRAYPRITGARVAVAAAAALAGSAFGWAGLVGGLLLSQLIGGVVGLLALGRERGSANGLAAAARHHAQAPRYLWPSALLDAITQQLPMALAVLWFTQDEAGQFSLAWRVLAVPVLMLAGAAGTVFYERFATLVGAGAAADRAAARGLLLRTWRAFAWIGLVPTVVLLLWGEPLFAALFGAGWRPAGALAAVLMPMLWAMLVSSPTSGALIVLGLQKWSPFFGVAMLVYRPAALWVGAQQGSLAVGLMLWAACEIAVITLYNLLLLRALRSA